MIPSSSELIQWALLPATLIAVWLPLICSLAILALRIRQAWPLRWWLGCVLVGIALGLQLTEWRSGAGLYMINGFVTPWLFWFTALARVPHSSAQWDRATFRERQLHDQLTDPGLIAAGVFLTLLFVDLHYAIQHGRLMGVGGAGIGDALFGQPLICGVLITIVRWLDREWRDGNIKIFL